MRQWIPGCICIRSKEGIVGPRSSACAFETSFIHVTAVTGEQAGLIKCPWAKHYATQTSHQGGIRGRAVLEARPISFTPTVGKIIVQLVGATSSTCSPHTHARTDTQTRLVICMCVVCGGLQLLQGLKAENSLVSLLTSIRFTIRIGLFLCCWKATSDYYWFIPNLMSVQLFVTELPAPTRLLRRCVIQRFEREK